MNADALITSLGSEAAREEALSELDRLLAEHTAGRLPEEELTKLEARAVEQPEFRRTLDAYAPLGSDVEQRIIGALRGVLGREPSRRSSGTHDSDVMRPGSALHDSSVRRGALHDSARASWASSVQTDASAAAPADSSFTGARSGTITSSFESEARAMSARDIPARGMPARVVAARGGMTFDRLRANSVAGSGYGGANMRGPHGLSHDDDRDPYTDRSACDPGLAGVFPVDGEEGFEQLMQQSYADGQLAWPTVKLGYDSFSAHVRRAVGKAPDWEWQRHAGDLYLCCACALGDRDATRLLDTQILPRAAKAIARIESDASFVDEALQILRHKLFVGPDAKISVYSGRGSLTAWLRVTATRVALDGLRALGAQRAQQVDLQDRMAQPSVNPLNDLVKSRYAEAFQEALRVALRELSVRDRNLLRLRLVGHCGIDQLGQMYRVHRATAARWLKAAHARVFDSVREQLRARFQLSDDEFNQMALDMQSRLELTLSGLGVDGAPLPLEAPAEAEPDAEDRALHDEAIAEQALADGGVSDRSTFDGSTLASDAMSEHEQHARGGGARDEDDDLPYDGVRWRRD